MVFQPGQSGNPTGDVKRTRIWKEAINRAIKRREAIDPLALEKLADKLLMKVDEGDVSAIKEFGDRIDGKVPQGIGQDPDLEPSKVEYSWRYDISKSTTPQDSSSSPSTTEPNALPALSPTDEPGKP